MAAKDSANGHVPTIDATEAARAERLRSLVGRDAPRAPDRASLEAWGRALGAALPRPATIAFSGDLGAGKTTLVRAICEGLGVFDLTAVTSPTFALVQEYAAPGGAVRHADLYRLQRRAELESLGWDEIVAESSILLVEWPDQAMSSLPTGTILVELRHDASLTDRRVLAVRLL